ncbi:uncharacterized protein LOC130929902 [Corythoichthys intestinalis]|uniref:uncharacterized protein LOC130929902 n=1 Tax=Corythoichthys intestinalis TaxID=161448 RepID=UPI0025A55CC6|nr:uncharacterized protein LOC130929902 [Corythoichthys intestinalis]
MEGEPKDPEEDCETTLLWQKCFRQRIVVDLSEDESLHLSDLQASALALHLSQAESAVSETGIHFSDDIASNPGNNEKAPSTKSNKLPNEKLQNRQNEESGQNTSDEDQEDLPYDGNLQSPMDSPQSNRTSNGRQTATNKHSTPRCSLSDESPVEKENRKEDANVKMDVQLAHPRSRPSVEINQLLLRHFSQEELQQTGRLIEAETLPEVSLLESLDDPLCNTSTNDNSGISEILSVKTCLEEGDNTPSDQDESVTAPTKCEECEVPIRKVSHLRSSSFSELKYGQGQVHYPLPDFSKVAPKVKIPKGPSNPVALVPQVPRPMIRTQSSPEMLEVISKVLQDSDLHSSEKPQVLKETREQTSPALVHHLKAEYDKLLAKYVRAENLIDKMRLGTNPSSDFCMEDELGNSSEGSHVEPASPLIPTLENFEEKVNSTNQDEMKLNPCGEDGTSEAEKMTAELRAVISQFMQSVDDFKQSVNNMSVSMEEQQMILRSLMETQDQLERKYMSKKEEHRALEMQNYLGLCRNVGTFDPNRLVEGDIFRVGMYLEDIKEIIDKNRREQVISPYLASPSKETTTKISVKASTPLSLLEESSATLTTECFTMETMTEAQKEDKDDTSKNDGSEPSNDSMQVSNGFPVCAGVSEKGLLDAEDEGKEAACLEEKSSHDKWSGISGRSSTRDEGVNRECDFAKAVEVSNSTDVHQSSSQGIVCRETDSGFGSSYLSQSGGILQPNPTAESDGFTTSDSEASSINLQTAIHPTDVSAWRRDSTVLTQPGSSTTVKLWVQNTAKVSSLKLHDPLANNHRAFEPILNSAMEVDQKQRHMCNCNSEAILTLQVEVSRLKKNLEERLLQLPHLTRKLDYLNSKYRQDRQERRTKTKTRTQHKQASSSRLRLEDWISTDMDPSKSKGTDSDSSSSERRLQFDSRPVGGSRFISQQESQQDNQESLFFKDRRSFVQPQPSQRPLLQVNYGSSCSLPASYKVKEPPHQVRNKHRKRSTQSDTALLPSDVYFQHTLSPVFQSPRNRMESKEEEMNRSLDQAIEAARSMKRTTDRMAKRLTADLAKAQLLPQGNVQNSATRGRETSQQFTER